MTKRFSYNVNKNCIEYDGKFVAYLNSVDGCRIANYWNGLYKENEQLKRRIGNLEHTRDFCDEVCADCERLEHENKQLKHQLQQQELEYAETCHRLKEENEKLESLWEDKCVREYLTVCGESILKEMHDEKYGDKE